MSQGQDILKVNKRFLILIRSCELNARFHVGHFKSVRLVSGEWIHQAKVINFRLLYRSTRKCITSTCSQMYGLWRENPLRRWKVLGDTTSHTKTIFTTWNEKQIWFGNRGYGNYDGRLTVLPLRWQLFIVRLSGLSWIVSFSSRTFSSFVSYISNSFLF